MKIDSQIQEHLLGVSRSFALTIPLLDEPLAGYVAAAYLVCRIADTVEDDPLGDLSGRARWLRDFSRFAWRGFAGQAGPGLEDLCLRAGRLTAGANACERRLMDDMPAVIARVRAFPRPMLRILSRGAAILARGMAASLEGRRIESLEDVDVYCYHVAGVVGELLAAMFAEAERGIPRERILELAVSFGEGLQLTNILKDRCVDAGRQASFLPPAADPGRQLAEYGGICRGHLEDALDFICLIPPSRRDIRNFCLVNILMAAATLKKLGGSEHAERLSLKISRRQVRLLLGLSGLCAGRNFSARLLFRLASLGARGVRRDPAGLARRVSLWARAPELFGKEQD